MKTNATSVPPPPSPANSFRLLLQDELARRCARNARYSLRSFARALAVDHSTLSQVLRGRRALSARAIERLGLRLGLTPDAIERYVDAERSGRIEAAPATLPEVEQLTHDAVRLVTEWHHYAILELCRLDTFQADSRWIARVLGIEVDAVNLAVSRLARLGLLHMSARGRWTDRSGNTAVSLRAFPEVAFRHLFEQVRQLTVAAAHRAPEGSSDHSTTTLAIASERLPEAIKRITRFRKELAELLEGDAKRDDVYRLEIHLFPITHLKQNPEA